MADWFDLNAPPIDLTRQKGNIWGVSSSHGGDQDEGEPAPVNPSPITPPAPPDPSQPPPKPGNPNSGVWQDTPQGIALMRALQAYMKDIFGREVSEDEVWAHLKYAQMPDQNFLNSIRQNLYNSDEAQTYRKKGKPPTPTDKKTATNSGNIQADWEKFVQAKGYTGAFGRKNMPQLIKEFNDEYGYDVKPGNPDAAGESDGFYYNGRFVDVIKSDNSWWWNEETGDGGASPLDPWTGDWKYPGFEPPPPFEAPTQEEAFNDKGFQFALSQGRDALEKSAASKGTLLTTGTLKDLDTFSQGLASQQYDKVYGRRLGEYESKYGHAETDYDRDRQNALNDYLLSRENFWQNQDRPFSKLLGLTGVGSGATQNYLTSGNSFSNSYSNALSSQARNQSDYYSQLANLQGSQLMNNANIWGGAINTSANWLPWIYQSMWKNKSAPSNPMSNWG